MQQNVKLDLRHLLHRTKKRTPLFYLQRQPQLSFAFVPPRYSQNKDASVLCDTCEVRCVYCLKSDVKCFVVRSVLELIRYQVEKSNPCLVRIPDFTRKLPVPQDANPVSVAAPCLRLRCEISSHTQHLSHWLSSRNSFSFGEVSEKSRTTIFSTQTDNLKTNQSNFQRSMRNGDRIQLLLREEKFSRKLSTFGHPQVLFRQMGRLVCKKMQCIGTSIPTWRGVRFMWSSNASRKKQEQQRQQNQTASHDRFHEHVTGKQASCRIRATVS